MINTPESVFWLEENLFLLPFSCSPLCAFVSFSFRMHFYAFKGNSYNGWLQDERNNKTNANGDVSKLSQWDIAFGIVSNSKPFK